MSSSVPVSGATVRTTMSRVTARRGAETCMAGTPAMQSAIVRRTAGRASVPFADIIGVIDARPTPWVPSPEMSNSKARSLMKPPVSDRIPPAGSGLKAGGSVAPAGPPPRRRVGS